MNTNARLGCIRAFTLVEIMIVVLLIGILIAIAVPSFFRARDVSRSNACVENLRQIEAAKTQYLLETHLPSSHNFNTDPLGGLSEVYPNYMKTIPTCQSGGIYSFNTGDTDASCSFYATDHTHSL